MACTNPFRNHDREISGQVVTKDAVSCIFTAAADGGGQIRAISAAAATGAHGADRYAEPAEPSVLEDRLQETLRMAQTLRRIHEVYSRMEREAADGLEFPVNHLGGIAHGRTSPGGTPVMPPFGVNGPDIIIVPKGVSAEEAISGLDIAMVLIQLRGVDILVGAAPVEMLTVEVPAGLTFGAYAAEG